MFLQKIMIWKLLNVVRWINYGIIVINEDSDARSVSKFDDDLYNRISKHDLNTEEGIKGYIQNNMWIYSM